MNGRRYQQNRLPWISGPQISATVDQEDYQFSVRIWTWNFLAQLSSNVSLMWLAYSSPPLHSASLPSRFLSFLQNRQVIQYQHVICYLITKLQQIQTIMQKTVLLLCLLSVALALTRVAYSGTNIDIVNPAGAKTVYPTKLNAEYPDVVKGYKWIWTDSGVGTGKKVVTFEYLTYLGCTGNITLTAAAYGYWRVYWDGSLVKTSYSYQSAVDITIEPKCGRHNLTIVVNKYLDTDYAGLVFLLQQDTTDCYKCNPNGYWEDKTCKCECLTTTCTCPANRKWNGYPVCGCKCPPRLPVISAISAASPTSSARTLQVIAQVPAISLLPASFTLSPVLLSSCPSGQYYSEVDCACRCKEQWCPARESFYDDPKYGCKCYPIIY